MLIIDLRNGYMDNKNNGFCPVGQKFCKIYKKLGKSCGKKLIKADREFCKNCVDCDYPFDAKEMEKLGPDFLAFLVNSGIYR